jgi:hypothetical protein
MKAATFQLTQHVRHVRQTSAFAACVWVVAALASCSSEPPCAVPGTTSECSCPGGVPGLRVCSEERTLGECDCSGTLGIPNPVVPGTGGTEAAGSGGTSAGTGSTAGTKAPPDDDDAGMADASTSDGGDAGQDSGPAVDPLLAYRACMTAADCDPDSQCVQTPVLFSPTFTVCAPKCLNTTDCPVPSGSYTANVACVTGFCTLDCTPAPVTDPLRTCPTGTTCIVTTWGQAASCHDDGV